MKKLGFGLMRLPTTDRSDDAKVDYAQVQQMVDLFLERGFTYFDTAWMYQNFASESIAKTVLVDRHPRESFTLATKLHAGFVNSLEDRDRILQAQLEHTGAGYFDYYLLHGVEEGLVDRYEQFDCFSWLQEQKRKGLARHIGMSFHGGPKLLDRLLTEHPELEFVQLQINYLDWNSEWIQSRACYEVALQHNCPVIVMEPVKGGTLAHLPVPAELLLKELEPDRSVASWAIRFAASLPGVMMVLSGMSSPSQMADNLNSMDDFHPLTEREIAACHHVAQLVNRQVAIACTGCNYCASRCPKHIAIAKYFSLYNEDMREKLEEKGWTINFTHYERLAERFGKASDCIACGQCEKVCPQHLPIIQTLRAVRDHYETET